MTKGDLMLISGGTLKSVGKQGVSVFVFAPCRSPGGNLITRVTAESLLGCACRVAAYMSQCNATRCELSARPRTYSRITRVFTYLSVDGAAAT